MDIEHLYSTSFTGSKNQEQVLRNTNASGFSAAADDYAVKGIDLNEQLIRNKPATFFLRVRGSAMTGAGIHDGDLVIVDRSIKAQNGRIVIAILFGEMLIRRFEKSFNKMRLIPETNNLSPIDIDPSCEDFGVWGVVTYVIHGLGA